MEEQSLRKYKVIKDYKSLLSDDLKSGEILTERTDLSDDCPELYDSKGNFVCEVGIRLQKICRIDYRYN